MNRTRGARIRSAAGRSLWALGVVALVAGAVVYPDTLPSPDPDPVEPMMLDVPAPSTVLVCPGTVRLPTEPDPGGDIVYDPAFDTAPGESVATLGVVTTRPSAQTTASRVLVESLEATAIGQVSPTASVGGLVVDDAEDAVVLRADAADRVPAWVAGALGVVTAEGDLRGLVAASCQYPAAENWLVGGSTALGSSARLVLQNPGATPASVTVRIWGPSGPVDLAGAPEYLVPPRSERAVLLEGVAAEQPRIVVQTSSSGGVVSAYLQDSLLRGFVPAGVDHLVGGQGPSLRQVVAFSVTETEVDTADAAVLRLLSPGDEPGTVGVTFLGPEGPVDLPGTTRIAVQAETVLDVPLGGLPAGSYLAVVDADVPVVAGGLSTRGAGVGGPTPEDVPMDRAWAASVATGRGGPLALPAGARGELLLAAVPDDDVTGPMAVTVEAIGADGQVLGASEHVVPDSRTLALDLASLATDAATDPDGDSEVIGVVLRTEDPRIAWTVVLLTPDDEMIGLLTPVPPRPPQPQVGVQLR